MMGDKIVEEFRRYI